MEISSNKFDIKKLVPSQGVTMRCKSLFFNMKTKQYWNTAWISSLIKICIDLYYIAWILLEKKVYVQENSDLIVLAVVEKHVHLSRLMPPHLIVVPLPIIHIGGFKLFVPLKCLSIVAYIAWVVDFAVFNLKCTMFKYYKDLFLLWVKS